MLGLTGQLVTSLAIGMSSNFRLTFYMRFLNGFLSGNTPITLSLIREVATDDNITYLYRYYSFGSGTSNALGSMIGGLANPSKNIGWIFENSFFQAYPYFIPFAIHALICSISLVLVMLIPLQTKQNTMKSSFILGVLKNKDYLVTVSLMVALSLTQLGFRVIFSISCKLGTEYGGMGIESEGITSLIQSFSGIMIAILPAYLTPVLVSSFGLIKSMVYLLLAYTPMVLAISYFNLLPSAIKYVGLSLVFGMINCASLTYYTYLLICISNSVSGDIVSSAFGVSNALAGIGRIATGPLFGIIFSWSISDGLEIPLIDSHFCYWLMAGIGIGMILVNATALDQAIERRTVKSKEQSLLDKSN